jgi:tRNA1Val (adenine37-N6)-methyltransferase
MANAYFQCKQFRIEQGHCAQKVSETACIQGAWTPVPEKARYALDIGSGTGLLSLMLAQRFSCLQLDAIELDSSTFEQGKQNISSSVFHSQIHCMQGDVRTLSTQRPYDFIISNPPFFENQLKSADAKSNLAKHATGLSLQELLICIDRLLHQEGSFSLLFPFSRFQECEGKAVDIGFYLQQVLIVKHTELAIPKVFVAIFSRCKSTQIQEEVLIIKNDLQYTNTMKNLLADFYLQG